MARDVPPGGQRVRLAIEPGEGSCPLLGAAEDDGVGEVLGEDAGPLGEPGPLLFALLDEPAEAVDPAKDSDALRRAPGQPAGQHEQAEPADHQR